MNRRATFMEGLAAKRPVYEALMLRFVIMRYGRENIGFLWVIVEPMLLCVGVMGIWAISKGKMEHGLNLSAVAFTGYMPLTLWRHQTNSMVHWLRGTKSFTMFRGITAFDSLVSKLFLEFVSVTASAIIVYLILHEVGVLPEIHDVSLMLIGWLVMGALGFGGGVFIASLSEASDITEKVIPPLQYFMLPFSGCFFMLGWLPDSAREAVAYAPWVHSFETFRAGFFGPAVKTYGDPIYAGAIAIIWAGIGLWVFNRIKDHIHG